MLGDELLIDLLIFRFIIMGINESVIDTFFCSQIPIKRLPIITVAVTLGQFI